jgi:hypothetical protein
MTENMPRNAKCNCLECRIRASLHGGAPTEPFELDINEAIKALGNILGEMLAHCPEESAERFAAVLLELRKLWLTHPRVLAQQDPKGHA